MIKLILVRHGESIANKKGIFQGQTYDTDLTMRGEKQVALLGKILKAIKADKIFTSPLRRTKETAENLGKRLHIPVDEDDRITEISHGKWEGRTRIWVESNYPELIKLWKDHPSRVQMPAGESLKQVCQRVRKFIKNLQEENDGQKVIVVGHDLIMRVIVAIILRLPLDNIWNFRLDNCGISILGLDKQGKGQLVVLNQNSYLGEHLSNVDTQAL